MTSTADQFMAKVREFSVAAGALTTEAWRELMFEGHRRIVLRNPVGNPDLWQSKDTAEYLGVLGVDGDVFAFARKGYVGGLSRGNWQVTVGEPATGVLPTIDPTGTATIAKARAVVDDVKDGEYVIGWSTNNLPYIEPLEDGWSTQAPQGMLAPTFVEMEAIAQLLVDGLADEFNREPAR